MPLKHIALLALAAAFAAALLQHGVVLQWAAYHAFADQRAWAGVPHAADVLSSLPFSLVGAWAWWRLRGPDAEVASQPAWKCFAAALLCTGAGSAGYHWAPDDAALVFDRLPIAWACAALLCAFLAERVDPRWASREALVTALLLATLSVVAWATTGDLRAYLFVQGLPLLLVAAGLLMRLRRAARAVPASAWWAVIVAYALAKALELADQTVFDTVAFVSGHTLKHLCAAFGAWLLLRAVPPGRQLQLR
jgi:hypothetical protein